MSADRTIDADTIEDHREDVDHPLLRLFLEYGRGSRRWFVAGLSASIAARFHSLVPPVLLGTALDAVFRDDAD